LTIGSQLLDERMANQQGRRRIGQFLEDVLQLRKSSRVEKILMLRELISDCPPSSSISRRLGPMEWILPRQIPRIHTFLALWDKMG
jgi:hypothetical protein